MDDKWVIILMIVLTICVFGSMTLMCIFGN